MKWRCVWAEGAVDVDEGGGKSRCGRGSGKLRWKRRWSGQQRLALALATAPAPAPHSSRRSDSVLSFTHDTRLKLANLPYA